MEHDLSAIIHISNGRSQLKADSAILKRVRGLVSYRAQDLPPVGVQLVIKAFMERKRSHGRENDVARVYDHPTSCLRLEELGWGPDSGLLTPKVFEEVMRLRGTWDGWRSLVSPAGYFGTGLLPHVRRALSLRMGADYSEVDRRERPPYSALSRRCPDLFDFQAEACQAWHDAGGRGVVNLPPRSGKTRIAIALIMQVGLPALVVVPKRTLVTQTVARFRQFLPASQVVGVTGGRPSAKKQRQLNHALVWVATPATAAGPKPKTGNNRDRRPGMTNIKSRRFLVIDEFHHAAADTWQDISLAARHAYYRLGLTGTHYRADGRDLVMHSVLSRCVYRRSVDEMVALGRLVPARVAMVRVREQPGDLSIGHMTGSEAYSNGVVNHPRRNLTLIAAAKKLLKQGRRVLVLAREVEHTRRLAASIPGAVQVDGLSPGKVDAVLEDMRRGTVRCVVGTSVVGEGVDVPGADALVRASGGKTPIGVIQDAFRPLTAAPGKRFAIIVDVADNHHERLLEAAAHRLALYRASKSFSVDVVDPGDLDRWLEVA